MWGGVEGEVADSYSFASIFIVFFLRVRVTFLYVTVKPIHSSSRAIIIPLSEKT